MNVVLISLFHYDDFAIRLLFSYLKAHNISVHYIGFKRMKQKATNTLYTLRFRFSDICVDRQECHEKTEAQWPQENSHCHKEPDATQYRNEHQ